MASYRMQCNVGRIWSEQVNFTQEDLMLDAMVKQWGSKKWTAVYKNIRKVNKTFDKTPKQCRDRWLNHLDPNKDRTAWSAEEEFLLFEKHRMYGSRWAKISKYLKNRSQGNIKNHFYSIIRKNIRNYNKSQKGNQKLIARVSELLKSPQLYKMLTMLPEDFPTGKKTNTHKREEKNEDLHTVELERIDIDMRGGIEHHELELHTNIDEKFETHDCFEEEMQRKSLFTVILTNLYEEDGGTDGWKLNLQKNWTKFGENAFEWENVSSPTCSTRTDEDYRLLDDAYMSFEDGANLRMENELQFPDFEFQTDFDYR